MNRLSWFWGMLVLASVLLNNCAHQAEVVPAPAPEPVPAVKAAEPEPPKWVPPPVYEKTDEEKVREGIMANEAYFRYLYNKHAKINPGLEGKIVIDITLDEFGNVIECQTVSSTVKSKELGKDLLAYLRTLRFDNLKMGDIVVTYPFVFAPMGRSVRDDEGEETE